MRRVGFIFLIAAFVVSMGLGLGACSKKTAPPVEIPDDSGTDTGNTTSQPIKTPPEVEVPETGPTELQDIFFDYDRSNLRPDALRSMEQNAKMLRDNGDLRVILEGHCDERGTTEYNLALGERRARAAYDYLVRFGIDKGRLSTVSYGEERPFDPGHSESAWAKNRRVHFVRR